MVCFALVVRIKKLMPFAHQNIRSVQASIRLYYNIIFRMRLSSSPPKFSPYMHPIPSHILCFVFMCACVCVRESCSQLDKIGRISVDVRLYSYMDFSCRLYWIWRWKIYFVVENALRKWKKTFADSAITFFFLCCLFRCVWLKLDRSSQLEGGKSLKSNSYKAMHTTRNVRDVDAVRSLLLFDGKHTRYDGKYPAFGHFPLWYCFLWVAVNVFSALSRLKTNIVAASIRESCR